MDKSSFSIKVHEWSEITQPTIYCIKIIHYFNIIQLNQVKQTGKKEKKRKMLLSSIRVIKIRNQTWSFSFTFSALHSSEEKEFKATAWAKAGRIVLIIAPIRKFLTCSYSKKNKKTTAQQIFKNYFNICLSYLYEFRIRDKWAIHV